MATLEGIALLGDPHYQMVAQAYPFVARRVLRNDAAGQLLRDMLYDSNGQMRPARLSALLQVGGSVVGVRTSAGWQMVRNRAKVYKPRGDELCGDEDGLADYQEPYKGIQAKGGQARQPPQVNVHQSKGRRSKESKGCACWYSGSRATWPHLQPPSSHFVTSRPTSTPPKLWG